MRKLETEAFKVLQTINLLRQNEQTFCFRDQTSIETEPMKRENAELRQEKRGLRDRFSKTKQGKNPDGNKSKSGIGGAGRGEKTFRCFGLMGFSVLKIIRSKHSWTEPRKPAGMGNFFKHRLGGKWFPISA